MQTIAFLLVSTGIVDRMHVQVIGKDTCTTPVVSLKLNGVAGIRVWNILITLLSSMVLWATSPCISQTTIGLIVCTNPLRNSTATIITRRSRTVGLNTRLWETVTLQTELNSMGTVAWYYEDNLWIA